jgi:hypothetical protein
MLEFQRVEQYRARKDYQCDLCRETIRKGREYIYEVQKFDGFLQELRRHIHCDALLSACLDATGEYEYDADGIACDIDELVCDACEYARDDECDKAPCFSCEIVQEALLTPTMLAAARQSVRENMEGEE